MLAYDDDDDDDQHCKYCKIQQFNHFDFSVNLKSKFREIICTINGTDYVGST